MAYDAAFFKAYLDYLAEPQVRKNHDRIFRAWFERLSPTLLKTVDLGCGTGEFFEHGYSSEYVGIDVIPRVDRQAQCIAANYLDVPTWKPQLTFQPNCFVSLFSAEPMLPPNERYRFYARMFNEFPSLKFGMSAGFYYDDRAQLDVVGETGGITSHQTIEPLGAFNIPDVDEERLVLRTPSKMFGPGVVEVWKFFTWE